MVLEVEILVLLVVVEVDVTGLAVLVVVVVDVDGLAVLVVVVVEVTDLAVLVAVVVDVTLENPICGGCPDKNMNAKIILLVSIGSAYAQLNVPCGSNPLNLT